MKITTQTLSPNKGNWLNVDDYHHLIDYQSLLDKYAVKNTLSKSLNDFKESKLALCQATLDSYVLEQLRRLNQTWSLKTDTRYLLQIVNHKFSDLGIAPSYRNATVPNVFDTKPANLTDRVRLFDLCTVDLRWLHAMHRHDGYIHAEGAYAELMAGDEFDSRLARDLIIGKHDIPEASSHLSVHSDIQWELTVYRSDETQQNVCRILAQTLAVKNDLAFAAKRNRRRGDKLLSRIPDRLAVWQAAKLGAGKTLHDRNQIYRMLTGTKIAPSSYAEKLSSTNAALAEVDSEYLV